jgi:hypothetical protein
MFREFFSETKWLLIIVTSVIAVLIGNIYYFTYQENKLADENAGIPPWIWDPNWDNGEEEELKGLEFKQLSESLYSLTGTVREKDCETIVPLMPAKKPFAVILESPGGSLFEGGCIASHLKLRNVITIVRDSPIIDEEGNTLYTPGLISDDGKVVCASSCSLMFLGGDLRYLIGDVWFGIHAPRTPEDIIGRINPRALEAEAYRTSASLLMLLERLGITNNKLRMMFIQVPSASMYWLRPTDWKEFPPLITLATHYRDFWGYSAENVLATVKQ